MPENKASNIQPWYTQALAWLVWLVSAGLGLYTVYSISKLSATVYALFGKEYYVGVLVGQLAAVIAGLAWIVSIVGSGEYMRKHSTNRGAWRLLGWIIGVEVILIILGILFG